MKSPVALMSALVLFSTGTAVAGPEKVMLEPAQMQALTQVLNLPGEDPIVEIQIRRWNEDRKEYSTQILSVDESKLAAYNPNHCLARFNESQTWSEYVGFVRRVWCRDTDFSSSNKQLQFDDYFGTWYTGYGEKDKPCVAPTPSGAISKLC